MFSVLLLNPTVLQLGIVMPRQYIMLKTMQVRKLHEMCVYSSDHTCQTFPPSLGAWPSPITQDKFSVGISVTPNTTLLIM